MNTYDLLLDSLAQTIALARIADGCMDDDDLLHGISTVVDVAHANGQLTEHEYIDITSTIWDMHGYKTIQFQDAF